uniref:type IV pilus assembly protein FimV n=1 Tax=uncultured Scardovia sp. TaxID=655654 RepID=UPI00374EB5E4
MISMVPPYAWPRSIADLRDSSLNPDSFTPVDGTGYTPTGLDMGDPRMAGVFELGLRIADTMEKRVAVMEAIRQSVYGFRGIPAAYAWPQSAEQLRSRGLYPDTFTPISDMWRTPSGLDLADPRAAEVLRLSEEAAALFDQRAALMEQIRGSSAAAAAVPVYGEQPYRQFSEAAPAGKGAASSVPREADTDVAGADGAGTDIASQASHAAVPLSLDIHGQAASIREAEPVRSGDVQESPAPSSAASGPVSYEQPVQGGLPVQDMPVQPLPAQLAAVSVPDGRFGQLRPQNEAAGPQRKIQILLLSLGIGLVALAAIVFAGFAYAQMDNGMRAVAIGALGIVSLLCSVVLSHRAKVTSEGLGYLGAAILVIDAFFMNAAGVIPSSALLKNYFGLYLVAAAAVLGLFEILARISRNTISSITICMMGVLTAGLVFLPTGFDVRIEIALLVLQACASVPSIAFMVAHRYGFKSRSDYQLIHSAVTVLMFCSITYEVLVSLPSAFTLFFFPQSRGFGLSYAVDSGGWSLAVIAAVFAAAAFISLWFVKLTHIFLFAVTSLILNLVALPGSGAFLDIVIMAAAFLWIAWGARAINGYNAYRQIRIVRQRTAAGSSVLPSGTAGEGSAATDDSARALGLVTRNKFDYVSVQVSRILVPILAVISMFRSENILWVKIIYTVIFIVAAALWRLVLVSSADRVSRIMSSVSSTVVVLMVCNTIQYASAEGIRPPADWGMCIFACAVGIAYVLLSILRKGDRLEASDASILRQLSRQAARPGMPAAYGYNAAPSPAQEAGQAAYRQWLRTRNPGRTGIIMDNVEHCTLLYTFVCTLSLEIISHLPLWGGVNLIVLYAVFAAVVIVAAVSGTRLVDLQPPDIASSMLYSAMILCGAYFIANISTIHSAFTFYELPVIAAAILLFISGSVKMARDTRVRSWPALGLASLLAVVPSILIAFFRSTSITRSVCVLLICVALVVIGAVKKWQAPLSVGAVCLVIHVLTVSWGYIAAFSRNYWWVWLALAGVILIITAAQFEYVKKVKKAYEMLR